MIEQIDNETFTTTSRGNKMTLRKIRDGWNVKTDNASSRAFGSVAMICGKDFGTLGQVEEHYKSWKGIEALVELGEDNADSTSAAKSPTVACHN